MIPIWYVEKKTIFVTSNSKQILNMIYLKKNNYQENASRLSPVIYQIVLFLFLFTWFSSINAQNTGNPDLLPKTYVIDSVIITARKASRDLMAKPYTEPNSILPSISKISHNDIIKQGATNVVEAMNYIPGGLIETRGRQVKQFFSVRGQKYPYPDYAINGVWQKEFEELPYFFFDL